MYFCLISYRTLLSSNGHLEHNRTLDPTMTTRYYNHSRLSSSSENKDQTMQSYYQENNYLNSPYYQQEFHQHNYNFPSQDLASMLGGILDQDKHCAKQYPYMTQQTEMPYESTPSPSQNSIDSGFDYMSSSSPSCQSSHSTSSGYANYNNQCYSNQSYGNEYCQMSPTSSSDQDLSVIVEVLDSIDQQFPNSQNLDLSQNNTELTKNQQEEIIVPENVILCHQCAQVMEVTKTGNSCSNCGTNIIQTPQEDFSNLESTQSELVEDIEKRYKNNHCHVIVFTTIANHIKVSILSVAHHVKIWRHKLSFAWGKQLLYSKIFG